MQASTWKPVFCRSVIVLLATASVVQAQAVERRLPERPQVCDMSMRLISVRLVDANGAPVPGAAITVRRVRTRTPVERAEAMGGQGDYRILEDGTLSDLRQGGEPFDVTFTKDGRRRRVRLLIGMDASGCHVALRSGATTIVL